MTLAEIFLLLLIVGWYGSRLESEGAGTPPGDPVAALARELEAARKALTEANEQLKTERTKREQNERILAFIAKTMGFPRAFDGVDEAKQAIDQFRTDVRRGKPSCIPQNTVIEVNASGGMLSVRLLQDLQDLIVPPETYRKGMVLADEGAIADLLERVDAFYSQRRSNGSGDCVFDYRLNWGTDSDYRASRVRFERYFYPAGQNQVP